MNKSLSQLARAMAELYPDVGSTVRLMADAEVNSGRILTEQPAYNRWFFIVLECEKAGRVPALLNAALVEYPQHEALSRFRTLWGEQI